MIAAVQSTKATFFKATTAKASRKSTVIRAGAYDAELIQTAVRHIVLLSLFVAVSSADRANRASVVDAMSTHMSSALSSRIRPPDFGSYAASCLELTSILSGRSASTC
jgi:hypothetical protein